MSGVMQSITAKLKRLAYYLFYPFYGYMDARFREVHERVNAHDAGLAHVNAAVGHLNKLMKGMRTEVCADARVTSETVSYFDRKVGEILEKLEEATWKEEVTLDPEKALDQLTEGEARFLALGTSYKGFPAKAGLWFNPPEVLRYKRGRVVLDQLHERLVEMPFVHAAAMTLEEGSRVLDVGSSESLLAITMATLGHYVTAMDIRDEYPIRHPAITPIVCDVTEWKGPKEPFDAIFCVSVLEHLGMEAYGFEGKSTDVDKKTLTKMRGWLKPGGVLVLTVPYGTKGETELERTYDSEFLGDLKRDWNVTNVHIYAQLDPTTWELIEHDPAPDFWNDAKRGVLLVTAER